jgi:beta-lactamase class A
MILNPEDAMKSTKRIFFLLLIALIVCFSLPFFGQETQDKTLRLPIGEAKLKDKTASVARDEIYSARAGRPVDFGQIIKDMEESRFIYVGESHDNMTMHDLQLRVIRALFEKDKRIAIGLEMLPAETQPVLDKWSQGLLTKDEFIHEVKWYIHWNMNFGFYEKIFDFAKENKLPIFALNAPRDLITKIRMKGWECLSDEEKALVPQPDLSSPDHRTLIRTIFEDSEIPHAMKGDGLEKMFEGLYRAQAAWDEVMAVNAIHRAEADNRKMIVLAGSGHLLYNLGINRRVYEKNRLPYKTVVAVELSPGQKSLTVARSLADFIWGIPEQDQPLYPAVGLALKKVEGLENLVIERKPIDGVALGGDFEKADVILSVDAKTFSDINELRIYLARFRWDEEAKLRLLRDGDPRDVVLKFQFKPQGEEPKKDVTTPPDKMKSAMAAAAAARLERLKKSIENAVKGAEGEVGVAVKHLESGQGLELNAGSSFPMASVFKLPILVEVLAQVKEGKFGLDDEVSVQRNDQHLGSGLISSLTAPGIKLSVRNLIQLMMMISDNSATDILLEKVGADNVNKRLKQFGVEGLSVNRTCQELIMDYAGLDYQKYKGMPLDQLEAESEKVREGSPASFKEIVLKFSQNPKDQSTPAAMNLLLEKVWKKEILDAASCDLIISIMLKCQTGEARIKGELPPGTAVAHKTGTIAGTVNDCGIIYLPDELGHIVLTVFTKNFMGKTSDTEKLIAEIARLVFDYFNFTS